MYVTAEHLRDHVIRPTLKYLGSWSPATEAFLLNAAKQELLRVPSALIADHGAVSEAVARAMAQGACQVAPVHATVAVTGIAGPGGGSVDKPVGTVWMAWCIQGVTEARGFCFPGDRQQVRQATVDEALRGLLTRLPHA